MGVLCLSAFNYYPEKAVKTHFLSQVPSISEGVPHELLFVKIRTVLVI